jgi:hypothetical protein
VQARTKHHIVPHIVRFVKEGSRIHTDEVSWSRLSEQNFRVDKWSLCRG